MEENRVRPRYVLGMQLQKCAVWLKHALPLSTFEKLIMNYYKI